MDSGSEIDFNDLPERTEFDTDVSDTEEEGGKRREAGTSRDSSPSRKEEGGSRDTSPSRKEVGHRSSSPSQAEDDDDLKSSSTESSAPKVADVSAASADTLDDSSDSEADVRDELNDDEEVESAPRDVTKVGAEESDSEVTREARSASPDRSMERSVSREASPARQESPAPRSESPVPREASPSPSPRAESPAPRSESPVVEREASLERKSSHGSSSYSERAGSMSPEPTEPISVPYSANKKPAVAATDASQKDITRIYTDKLVNEKPVDSFAEKVVRNKPAGGDITQIYTASIQAQKEQQSPRLERARGGKPVKDITQLYTANLSKPEQAPELASPNRPRRNVDITKLYTDGFEAAKNNFKGKPSDEITNPKKHNMSTTADKEGIRDAYTQVMADNNGVEWAVFKFDEANRLVVSGTGEDMPAFKAQFGPDDRGFGYVKVHTGDEMSKRSRFVLVTWVGANTSVMKKAKMSTDKLLVKEIIQNLSVEITTENSHELSFEHLKSEVDKAGGARYGTGVREK